MQAAQGMCAEAAPAAPARHPRGGSRRVQFQSTWMASTLSAARVALMRRKPNMTWGALVATISGYRHCQLALVPFQRITPSVLLAESARPPQPVEM